MGFEIFKYELRYWLKNPAIYIYFLVFFLFSLASFLGTGGYFDTPSKSKEAVRLLNSPHELNYLFQYLGKLFLFLLPAIIGRSIYRDFKNKVFHILYSFPISKAAYLAGKFWSAFFVVILVISSSGFAFLIGERLLGVENINIGDFNFLGYLQAYFIFLIPNLFVFGGMVFAIVTLTRSIYSGFVLVLLLFFIQIIAENVLASHPFLTAIADPFGQNAVGLETQFWTLTEQNTKLIPIIGAVLYNRLLWFGVALLIFIALFKKFSLTHHKPELRFWKPGRSSSKINSSKPKTLSGLDLTFDFSWSAEILSIWRLSTINVKYIIRNPMFLIFVILAIAAVITMIQKVTNGSEMIMLPLTRLMLHIPTFFYITITTFVTFIYSGMLIHRDRIAGMDTLINVTPTPDWVLLISKTLALIKIQMLLLLVLIVCGITLQLSNGFFRIDIPQYLFYLFVITLPILSIWTFASIFIHTISPNLYVGLFLLLLLWLGKNGFSEFGIKTYLLQFNAPPTLIYSDINGYGNQLAGYFTVLLFWMTIGVMTLLGSYLFWCRERTFTYQEKLRKTYSKTGKLFQMIFGMLCVLLICTGYIIYQVEKTDQGKSLNKYDLEKFKSRFGKYENQLQPRITSIRLKLDLYPESNHFDAFGTYTLVNKSEKNIDTLLIKTGFDEITTVEISSKNSLIEYDSGMHFFVFLLHDSVTPEDSIYLTFNLKNTPNTLFQRNSNVIENGTFLKHDILPRLGYFASSEKSNPHDSTSLKNHYQAIDSDLIDFEATISTSKNQKVIASGVLQNEWQENDRNVFHYKTDHPMKLGMAINSLNYSHKSDSWNQLPIEIYYHDQHQQNVDHLIAGAKCALGYNTAYFSSYPHQELNIIEFPLSEGSYATSIANALLVSEVRFGVNPKKDQIDLSFYVAAHELTHQWFGNQLIPKDALGAMMLSESITEYITLNIYRKHFGEQNAQQFLKKQRQRYLSGRTKETGIESPLYLVKPEQDYISYGKGALAFNSLAHLIGETELNLVLKSFLEKYSSQNTGYPTSIDFLNMLKKSVTDSMQYLITDLFETITFHENEIKSATIEKSSENEFTVAVEFTVRKYRNEMKESHLPLNDFIEIGFYDEENNLLDLRMVKIESEENRMLFSVRSKPAKVVLDPHILTIEINIQDNEYDLMQ